MKSEIFKIFEQSKVVYDDSLGIFRSRSIVDLRSRKIWDEHWLERGSPNTLFERMASFYRRAFISRLVAKYCDDHLPKRGVILEAGSGTADASWRIPKRKRTFIACDISVHPLLRIKNKNIDIKLQADIFDLPLRNRVLDGIYNVGVMEHFTFDENLKILREFRRVLKPDGVLVLFWPWKYCWVEIMSKIKPLFPPSPSMFGTFDFNDLVHKTGFEVVLVRSSPLDGFIHKVVVLKRKS